MPLNTSALTKKMFDAAGLDKDHVKEPTAGIKAIAKGVIESLKATKVGHDLVTGNALLSTCTFPVFEAPDAESIMYRALEESMDAKTYEGNSDQLKTVKENLKTIAGNYAKFLAETPTLLSVVSFVDTATTTSPGDPGKVSGKGAFISFPAQALRDIFANGAGGSGADPSLDIFKSVEAYVIENASIDYSPATITGTVALIGLPLTPPATMDPAATIS